jgi:PBP1b-binding outer membrane lipoprotein LpoB
MRKSTPAVTALAALALLLAGCAGGTAPSDDMEEPMPSCSPSEMMSETEEPMDESMSEEPMDDEAMKDDCEDDTSR